MILAAYFTTLAAFLAFGLHPAGRVWGFNLWSSWQSPFPWIFAAVLAPIPFLVRRLERPFSSETPASGSTRGPAVRGLALLALALLGAIVFTTLRARTHFLGDGYQTLSLLERDPPFVKGTAPLLGLFMPRLRALFGDDPKFAALAAYQTVSVVCGVVFLFATALFAKGAFPRRRERFLFVALVVASGPTLLFFGYVENYAPFVVLSAITIYVGIAALEGRVRRGWILAPAVPLVFAHAFGPLAIPAVAYVLLPEHWRTPPPGPLRRRLQYAAALLAAVAAATLLALLSRDLRVRLAVLPIQRTWFSPDGYTLFSKAHLLDVANLAFLLFPGIAVVAAAALRPLRLSDRTSVAPFLALFLAADGIGVFALAPALGMPRDWDLFAFAGIPVVVGAGLALLRHGEARPEARGAAALAVALGLASLGPRIAQGFTPELAAARFHGLLELDVYRARTGRSILVSYYVAAGRMDLAEIEATRVESDYPERELVRRADEANTAGMTDEAIALSREALAYNSGYNEAYMLLGEGLLLRGECEESVVMSERAYALSGDAFRITHNLGLANGWLGRSTEAEKWWKRALAIQPDSYEVNLSLSKLYETMGRERDSLEALRRAARSERAAPEVVEAARKKGVGPP